MHRSAIALTTLAAACLAACSSTPKPASPAPETAAAPAAAAPANAPAAVQPAPQRSLAGEWEVRISSAQKGTIASMMRIVARGDGYIGLLQPLLDAQGESVIPGAGPSPFQIRSATLEGNRATIIIDLDGDDGRVVASFRSATLLDGAFSSRALSGRVTLQKR